MISGGSSPCGSGAGRAAAVHRTDGRVARQAPGAPMDEFLGERLAHHGRSSEDAAVDT